MYQARVSNVVVPSEAIVSSDVDDSMWKLFLAVGAFWKLEDDPESYRLRFRGFMENRISINPMYRDFYIVAKVLIDGLIAQLGEAAAYEQLFTNKPRIAPVTPPQSQLEFVQHYVANEFIGFRLALGGFKAFGAINYCGYMGGANIKGQPVPYRTPSQGE
jgi:hypothetical protein